MAGLSLPVFEVAATASEDVETVISQRARQDAQLPYDLARAPLMRCALLRASPQEHVLLLNFHHIIIDASSLANFYRELALIYDRHSNPSAASLPTLPLQFADYASWQQSWLKSSEAATQLAYWKRQLAGPVIPLELPADFPRPALQNNRGARVTRRLSKELTAELERLSRHEGTTLFMTLLAAFTILLARLSGRDDIIVGSTIAGRNRAEFDGMIGFFINPLTLRIDVSGNPSFRGLLQRAREVCLDGYTHQELPYEIIVEALQPAREPNRNPLFQVMFNMNEVGDRDLTLRDCRTEKITQGDAALKFDIVLYAPKRGGAIELSMVYNADLFSAARIEIYLEQLMGILEQAVAAPEHSIDRYSLLTAATRTALPDPAAPLRDGWEGSVHTLVGRVAQRNGDRLAVVDANDSWSYRELDEQSSQLANYFIRSGIEKGEIVAIYAQRSASLVVALLGAVKAGAPFAVLDPAYPAPRLIDYLRIARPRGWLQLEPVGALPGALAQFLDSAELRCRIRLGADKNDSADCLSSFPGSAPEIPLG
ncbi:MAG TPA: condensation domain-containing protein, partial [Candidatus Binatus sp.]|nr:condensation domain-containing protein [Candidatus Binatus sp.]